MRAKPSSASWLLCEGRGYAPSRSLQVPRATGHQRGALTEETAAGTTQGQTSPVRITLAEAREGRPALLVHPQRPSILRAHQVRASHCHEVRGSLLLWSATGSVEGRRQERFGFGDSQRLPGSSLTTARFTCRGGLGCGDGFLGCCACCCCGCGCCCGGGGGGADGWASFCGGCGGSEPWGGCDCCTCGTCGAGWRAEGCCS